MSNIKPRVLVLGVTGQLGSIVAKELQKKSQVELVVTSRNHDQLNALAAEYGNAVYLDLDKPETLDNSLQGIDYAFLLTSYTVNMVTQSKIFIDAAKRAGVSYIVHVGVYSRNWDCTIPHFAWHQMIEAYIDYLGFDRTFLHPNCFMQNLSQFSMVHEGKLCWYTDKPCGWVALEDVAECAAKILSDGPEKHKKKDYWFSTESLSVDEVTKVITNITGKELGVNPRSPEDFIKNLGLDSVNIDPYFYSVAESFRQVQDGHSAYLGEITDEINYLLQRSGLTLSEWVQKHKNRFIDLIQSSNTKENQWGG